MTAGDIAAVMSAIFAGLSALFAWSAVYVPWKAQTSKQFLDQAILSLERAHLALFSELDGDLPKSNRLNWLTAARHIQRYKEIKKEITVGVYRTVCDEHEEYWRHQFYIGLGGLKLVTTDYYEKGSIEPTSAVIIYSFSSWSKDKPDPIDQANIQALIDEYNPLQGRYGLKRYLETKKST